MKIQVLSVLILAGQIGTALACDCNGERSPISELLKKADAVFIGTLQSAEKSNKTFPADPKMLFYELKFVVNESLLGDSIDRITIVGNNTNCTPIFVTGKKYLVYSYFNSNINALSVSQCFSICPEFSDRTAQKDLRKIRRLISARNL